MLICFLARDATGYMFRHGLARRLFEAVGANKTRHFMGHNARTTTLEEAYVPVASTIDIVAHILGEEPTSPKEMLARGTPATLR